MIRAHNAGPRPEAVADESGEMSTIYALLEKPAWMDHAACKHAGNQLFFAERGEIGIGGAKHPAIVVCEGCPVKTECLEYGLWESVGVWGGKTPRQRRALRKGLRSPNLDRDRIRRKKTLDMSVGRGSGPRCGTYAGYHDHHKNQATPCGPCLQARRDYTHSRRTAS